MPILQPKFRDQSNTQSYGPEYRQSLASKETTRYDFMKYPADIEKTLQTAVLFSFNVIEDSNDRQSPNSEDPAAYYTLSGSSANDTTSSTGVPNKNRAWSSIQQQQKTDKIDPSKISSSLKFLMRKYKRTDVFALLPMPQNIAYETNAGWNNVDGSTAAGLLANIVLSDANAGDKWAEVFKDLATGAEHAVANKALGEGMGSALSKSIQNSFQDQAFAGMERRRFEFSWTFAPKNQTDLINLASIIELFRFQAHPSVASGDSIGNYLIFPGQVDVEWYIKENDNFIENAWLPKIATCVIESISTNYTPNSQFSFFQNAGAPTHYTFSLTLKEVVPLTKIDVSRGF